MIFLLALVIAASWQLAAAPLPAVAQDPRPRLLVLTDIGGDPDDMQSMRRLMLYANDFRIEGLIASASGIARQLDRPITRPDLIREIVDDYAAVWPNLRRHDARYPDPELLGRVVGSGSPERGVTHLGEGRSTEGSRRIISAVDASDEPLHVVIWGGAHDLAQALFDVRESRNQRELTEFVSKLRVYAIGDQDSPRIEGREGLDGTGAWTRRNFPDVRYLQAGPPGSAPMAALFRGMYQNDSAGGDHPTVQLVRDDVIPLTQRPWVEENVLRGHGPLGAEYPIVRQNPGTEHNTEGVKEGDTPSWFYVLPTGLNDPEQPTWGGWGGRFEPATPNHFFDAEDEHWSGNADPAVRQKWTVARWREAYQNDFAARLDRAVRPFAEVNHAPTAVLNRKQGRHPQLLAVRAGTRLRLDAGGSIDPDGDELDYRWWIYREPSGYAGRATLGRSTGPTTTLTIPRSDAGAEIHVILEVTDDGEPSLTSYRRAVVSVR